MADVVDGRTTVTTAGTRVPLATSLQVETVYVQALSGNTNAVEVGSVNCVAATATQRGLRLTAGQTTPALYVDDLADLYVDSITNGEGVSYVAVTAP